MGYGNILNLEETILELDLRDGLNKCEIQCSLWLWHSKRNTVSVMCVRRIP